MAAIKIVFSDPMETRKNRYWFMLSSTEDVETLPTSGADIEGAADNITIARGSVLMVPGKKYFAYDDNAFQEVT